MIIPPENVSYSRNEILYSFTFKTYKLLNASGTPPDQSRFTYMYINLLHIYTYIHYIYIPRFTSDREFVLVFKTFGLKNSQLFLRAHYH